MKNKEGYLMIYERKGNKTYSRPAKLREGLSIVHGNILGRFLFACNQVFFLMIIVLAFIDDSKIYESTSERYLWTFIWFLALLYNRYCRLYTIKTYYNDK